MRWSVLAIAVGLLMAVPFASHATPEQIAEGGPVEVFDVKREPSVLCPSKLPPIASIRKISRCELEEAMQESEVTVLTAVGEMSLGTCSFYMNVNVYADGSVVSSLPSNVGGGRCSDIDTCGGDRYEASLRGQLYLGRNGDVHRVLPLCIDSWIGRFEGETDVALHFEQGGELWSHDVRVPLGMSGLAFNGRWRLKRNIHQRMRESIKGVRMSVRPAKDGDR